MYDGWVDNVITVPSSDGVLFLLSERRISILKEDAASFIREHAVCHACGKAIAHDFSPCECGHRGWDQYRIGPAYQDTFWKIWAADTQRMIDRKKRALRKERTRFLYGFHLKEDIEALYELQKGACAYCAERYPPVGRPSGLTVDHIESVIYGGDDWPSNLWLVCRPCNSIKHTKSIASFFNILKEQRGAEFVSGRRKELAKLTPEKRKLTNKRKKQLAQKAKGFGFLINETLKKNFANHFQDDYYAKVTEDGRSFIIQLGNASTSIPIPPFLKIEAWQKRNINAICRMIKSLSEMR